MRLLAVVLLLTILSSAAHSQAPISTLVDMDSSFDVKYVKMDLTVRPDTEYIAGFVELHSVVNQLRPDRTVQLSLRKHVSVDSIFVDGQTATFTRDSDKLFVALPNPYAPHSSFTIHV